MATEEQLSNSTQSQALHFTGSSGTNFSKAGQKLTISDRSVTKLGLWLQRQSSPNGTITFTIRDLSDNIMRSKLQGNAIDLSTTKTFVEVTFDSPVYINEEVRISAEATNSAGGSNTVLMWGANTDVKGGELFTRFNQDTTTWADVAVDMAYIYTYDGGAQAPSVTTDELVAAVTQSSATAFGEITSIGNAAVTQHGHALGTSSNPDLNDTITQLGVSGVGLITSLFTDLAPATTYHIRAYATNANGTTFGADRTFLTLGVGFPATTTENVSALLSTTVTAHGTITSIGDSAVTQSGHAWNTSVNPLTSDNATTNGAAIVGAFTSSITGLTANTTYYVRAYATNTQGTAYSGESIVFKTPPTSEGGVVSSELSGGFGVVQDRWHWFDAYGREQFVRGTPV